MNLYLLMHLKIFIVCIILKMFYGGNKLILQTPDEYSKVLNEHHYWTVTDGHKWFGTTIYIIRVIPTKLRVDEKIHTFMKLPIS